MSVEDADLVGEAWKQTMLDPAFPCVGGAGAVRRGDYRHRTYSSLADDVAADRCAEDLVAFFGERAADTHPVSVFTASFPDSYPADEAEFERDLFGFLDLLSRHDPRQGSEPAQLDEGDDIGFVFDHRHLFVVGMHPHAHRHARRFSVPTLVFNSLSHVAPLRPDGRLARMTERIRARDERLQGAANPCLDLPRPAQFSGRQNSSSWTRPR